MNDQPPSVQHSLAISPDNNSAELTAELAAIFDAMEDGVCVQSADARVLRANKAFAAMLGLPMEKIIGATCAELFNCANTELCARMLSNQTTTSESEEFAGRQPGQRLRARVSTVRSADGQVKAYVMVVRDITELILRERELARAQQLVLIGELTAGLAHEIKNPLAGIQGAMDILLQRRQSSDPEYSVLNNVRQEVARIDSAVQSLLARTRPRSIKLSKANLNEVVAKAVRLALTQYTNQITIQYQPLSEPIVALIDAPQIEDAVLNLIINAIEAIESSGWVKVKLTMEHNHSQPGEVIISVSDNGRGIAKENINQIFSPFFTTKQTGTGLGLAAVRRIMRIHGGQVKVDSRVGEGTTFQLCLPVIEKIS